MEALHEGALRSIGEVFGDRLKKREDRGGELASVFPVSAGEVELLARLAESHSVPLVALGAETASNARSEEGSILVRFDLMRNLRLPESDASWAEAEPGALWLALDNDLHARGRGLTVYPTSAPRATVGGWVAQNGLGVGSFEYGWLHENIVSADVVMPGGERRSVRGVELGSVVGRAGGIVVGTTLRTRRAENDVAFAVAFGDPEDVAGAVASISRAGTPLWHLAFLSPEMARVRGLGEGHLLFGAYPGERGAAVEEALDEVASSNEGRVLPNADAYRVWGERFFPVIPSHPTPHLSDRTFVTVEEIARSLRDRSGKAVQGSVARSGEVLLLAFDPGEVSPAS